MMNDYTEDLGTLQFNALEDSKRWFPELHTRPHRDIRMHFALGLTEEAGEVGGVVKKADLCGGLLVDECRLHKPGKHSRRALEDEMADVFIYLCALAELEGVNLAVAVARKKIELRERWDK